MSQKFDKASEYVDLSSDESDKENENSAVPSPAKREPLAQAIEQFIRENQVPTENGLESVKVPEKLDTENGDPADDILNVIALLCQDENLGSYIGQNLMDFEDEKKRSLGGKLKLNYTMIIRIIDFYLYNIAHTYESNENIEATLDLIVVYDAFKKSFEMAAPFPRQSLLEFLEKQLGFSKKIEKRVSEEAVLWNLQQIVEMLYFEGGEETRNRRLAERRFKPY
ncbi:unnamed protein product [Caenorhabditis brenneri]